MSVPKRKRAANGKNAGDIAFVQSAALFEGSLWGRFASARVSNHAQNLQGQGRF